MKAFATLLSFLLIISSSLAQPVLKPTIGIGSLPADADTLCSLYYLGPNTFETNGPSVGDTIADFSLYDMSDVQMNMANLLGQGKPVLMIDGSYTCPVFRNKIPTINALQAQYGNSVNIIIINVIEAHPIAPDESPYFGAVNDAGNPAVGINILQPTTYGEQRAVVQEMIDSLQIDVPIYLDGPCHEWWYEFGPAPNNAYLVNTDGTVFAKHGWFDKAPQHDIYCDLDSILSIACNTGGPTNGTFGWNLTNTDSETDVPGSTILVEGQFTNSSGVDVIIDVDRLTESIPNGWQTSICVDVCLDYWISNTTFQLDSGMTQTYHMWFYTDNTIDSGGVEMRFTNQADPGNVITEWFYAYTDSNFVSIEIGPKKEEPLLYPNPVVSGGEVQVRKRSSIIIDFYDILGNRIKSVDNGDGPIDIPEDQFSPGVYFYTIVKDGVESRKGRLVVQ